MALSTGSVDPGLTGRAQPPGVDILPVGQIIGLLDAQSLLDVGVELRPRGHGGNILHTAHAGTVQLPDSLHTLPDSLLRPVVYGLGLFLNGGQLLPLHLLPQGSYRFVHHAAHGFRVNAGALQLRRAPGLPVSLLIGPVVCFTADRLSGVRVVLAVEHVRVDTIHTGLRGGLRRMMLGFPFPLSPAVGLTAACLHVLLLHGIFRRGGISLRAACTVSIGCGSTLRLLHVLLCAGVSGVGVCVRCGHIVLHAKGAGVFFLCQTHVFLHVSALGAKAPHFRRGQAKCSGHAGKCSGFPVNVPVFPVSVRFSGKCARKRPLMCRVRRPYLFFLVVPPLVPVRRSLPL